MPKNKLTKKDYERIGRAIIANLNQEPLPISKTNINNIKSFLKDVVRGRDYSMSPPVVISEDMAELILKYIDQLENNQKINK